MSKMNGYFFTLLATFLPKYFRHTCPPEIHLKRTPQHDIPLAHFSWSWTPSSSSSTI